MTAAVLPEQLLTSVTSGVILNPKFRYDTNYDRMQKFVNG